MPHTTYSGSRRRFYVEVLEARIAPATVLALAENNSLLRFDHTSPTVIDAVTQVTGLGDGETLVGIDSNPLTGVLGGLSLDGANTGRFYTINVATGQATLKSILSAAPSDATAPFTGFSDSRLSWDFDTVNRGKLRIVSQSGDNLSVDFETGLVTTDAAPNYSQADASVGAPLNISGVAFSGSYPSTFYAIDTEQDALVYAYGPGLQESGTFRSVEALRVDASGSVGLDTEPGLYILLSLSVDGATALYDVGRLTGVDKLGNIGDGTTPVRDIAIVSNVWTGAGSDANWSNAENWGAKLAPAPGSSLLFPKGAARLDTWNDYPSGTPFDEIRLEATGYQIAGNQLELVSSLFALEGTVTIDADIKLPTGGPGVYYAYASAGAGARLELNGNVDLDGNTFGTSGLGTVNVNGHVSGEGGLIASAGNTNVAVSDDFEGYVSVDGSNSTLSLAGDSPNAAITVSGTIDVEGRALSLHAFKNAQVNLGGSDVANLTLGSLTLNAGSTFFADLYSTTEGRSVDQFIATQSVNLGGKLVLNAYSNGEAGAQFTLIDNQGGSPVQGAFEELPEGSLFPAGDLYYTISYTGGDGNDVVLTQVEGPTALILGLTSNNSLLLFDNTDPTRIHRATPITGFGMGETLVGIDFNPFTGLLGGLTIDSNNVGRFYAIDPIVGLAVRKSTVADDPVDTTAPFIGLSGTQFTWDFSLTEPGKVRILSDSGQNLRVDFHTGLVTTDGQLSYLQGDPNQSEVPAISGLSYIPVDPESYLGIDTEKDTLVRSLGPSNQELGRLKTEISLGVDVSGPVGYDIDFGFNHQLASLSVGGVTGLYHLDAYKGAMKIGLVGDGNTPLRDLAIVVNAWTGAAGDGKWTTHANWASGIAPTPGSNLLFSSGAAQLQVVNDFPAGTAFNFIRFETGGYEVSGNGITVEGSLFATGGVTTIQADVRAANTGMNAPRPSFSAAPSGHIIFNGVLDLNGLDFRIGGLGKVDLNGDIVGSGSTSFSGGTSALNGTKSFTGPISIGSNGVLQIVGDHSSHSVLIQDDTSLVGAGAVGDLRARSGGKILPGDTELATISIDGNLRLEVRSSFVVDLYGLGLERKADQLVVSGGVVLGGSLVLNVESDNQAGAQFVIIDNHGSQPVEGVFSGLPEGGFISSGQHHYQITYQGGDGNDVVLTQLWEPTIAPDGRSTQFTDIDGDLVTVSVSKGLLQPWRFRLLQDSEGRSEFLHLDLSTEGTGFEGANVKITAVPQDLDGDGEDEGDGFVNMGQLNAADVSLGKVAVDGYLGAILSGGSSPSGLKSLTVQGMGGLDKFTVSMDHLYRSIVFGSVSDITVRENIEGSFLMVAGHVGSLSIGGSIIGDSQTVSGSFHSVGEVREIKIAGDIVGATGDFSGSLQVGGKVKSLSIGGSVQGDAGWRSGSIQIGTLLKGSIDGGIIGGANEYSGSVSFSYHSGTLKLASSIVGGNGDFSGSILVSSEHQGFHPRIKSISVKGGVVAGNGVQSGVIHSEGGIESTSIFGDVSGGIESNAGVLSKVRIKGNVEGTIDRPARVSGLGIGAVEVKGSMNFAEISSGNDIGTISIRDSVQNSSISATGSLLPEKSAAARAIAKITVGGNFDTSRIVAGYDRATDSYMNPDAGIGSVSIGGDLLASSIVAGIHPLDAHFGDADDRVIGDGGVPEILARIARITIGGQVSGSELTGDAFGIVAERIDRVKIGKAQLPLTETSDAFNLGEFADVAVREESRKQESLE